MARVRLPGGQRYDVAAQYWMPSLTAVVLLFMGGWFAANLAKPAAAGGAFVTTMTVKGKVVRVHGRAVRVLVPAHTLVKQGRVITMPASTINLTQTQTQTQTQVSQVTSPTVTGLVTSTVIVPTTVTQTATAATPVTVTDTVPPVTSTQTETTTVTTTVTSSAATS